MKKILFTIHETVWWVVAELEDWLYPYRDREVTQPLWAENYDMDVDELTYLKSQMNSANERIERLQSEMIYVTSEIHSINTELKEKQNPNQSNEGQEGSEAIVKESKETP